MGATTSTLTPIAASTFAGDFDNLYIFLVAVSALASLIVIGGMTYFLVKYRRKSANDKTAYIDHNHTLEFIWSFIPFVIFMVIFAWGAFVYYKQRVIPENPYVEIHVKAWQWQWEFQYPNGKTSNDLVAPVNRPVKLIMTSTDVIHSLFVPAFRMKQDVVPGMFTQAWFEANQTGEFQIFCTEFCGTKHSEMLAKVKIITEDEFKSWMWNDSNKGKPLAALGQELFNSKGCTACHSVDGSAKIGPSLQGLIGKERTFTDGSKRVADENYIRDSVLTPQKQIVNGFATVQMTSFQGLLNEDDIKAIAEFIKTLK